MQCCLDISLLCLSGILVFFYTSNLAISGKLIDVICTWSLFWKVWFVRTNILQAFPTVHPKSDNVSFSVLLWCTDHALIFQNQNPLKRRTKWNSFLIMKNKAKSSNGNISINDNSTVLISKNPISRSFFCVNMVLKMWLFNTLHPGWNQIYSLILTHGVSVLKLKKASFL